MLGTMLLPTLPYSYINSSLNINHMGMANIVNFTMTEMKEDIVYSNVMQIVG